MNIYIMRDGQKIGPFGEEAVRVLIEQGDVEEEDLACRKGSSTWEPLSMVLDTASSASVEPPTMEPAVVEPPVSSTEPATAAQIAFLSYFGIVVPAGLLEGDAEKLIAKATEDPKSVKRLAMWKVDRLHLHPDLFAAEAQAKKENRAQFFFDLCQTAGSDYFTGVTKAHCQVLVAFLDVKFPRWDAHEAEATERYFFPAMAEKFPQLVNKAWRGRLHYGQGQTAAGANATRKSPTAKLSRRSDSPVRAILRGLVLGLCVLAVLYAVHRAMQGGKWSIPAIGKSEKAAMLPHWPGTIAARSASAALSSASRA
ncbi:MAG: DUF4339 domain-containing protein [Chthoniobacter sp.]|uniref:DUF4339 domain-containing protein n=1 Tax=Chthoniobacter sp. TaxID=2510640 RepID=UPI0032AB1EF6